MTQRKNIRALTGLAGVEDGRMEVSSCEGICTGTSCLHTGAVGDAGTTRTARVQRGIQNVAALAIFTIRRAHRAWYRRNVAALAIFIIRRAHGPSSWIRTGSKRGALWIVAAGSSPKKQLSQNFYTRERERSLEIRESPSNHPIRRLLPFLSSSAFPHTYPPIPFSPPTPPPLSPRPLRSIPTT